MALRVLIVEDEAILALDLEGQVEDAGHIVVAIASDTDQAVRAAETERPDLAFMDIRLARGSSGVEAARILRERWNIPCVFLSANLDPATRAAVAPLLPLGFINKPFHPRLVREALAAAADKLSPAG